MQLSLVWLGTCIYLAEHDFPEQNRMADDLDQDAINTLFRSNASADADSPTPINFARLGSISPEQMQMLTSVNQVFSQNLGMTLSARLGAPINLTMVAAERSLYHKLIDTIDLETAYLAQSRFKNPDARSLISMDLSLVEPLVHLALGGLTTIPKVAAQRELTQIDVAILEILMNAFCTEMNSMWAQFGLQAAYESRVVPVHAKRFFPPAEYVLSFTYEMEVGDRKGSLQVILATVIASALLRDIDIRDNDRAQPPATRRLLQERLGGLNVRTSLRLPPFKVMASDIVNLHEGMLLESNLPTTTSCLLGMADGPLWEAVPMLSDERIAAKLLRSNAESLPKR